MKRILSFLFALCLFPGAVCVCAASRPPQRSAPVRKEPVVLATLSRGGQVTEYYYDEDGHVVLEQERYSMRDVNITYTYHDNGVVSTKTTPTEFSTEIVHYDTHGNITGKGELLDSGKTEFSEIYTNQYDSQDRLIKVFRTDSTGTDSETITYTYEKDGSFQVFYDEGFVFDGKFEPHCRRTAWFTPEGVLYREEREYEDMAPIVSASETQWDDQGNIIYTMKEIDYRPSGTEFYEIRRDMLEHTYDDDGRLQCTDVYYIYLKIDGEDITDSHTQADSIIKYTYNKKGLLERAVTTDPSGKLMQTVKYTYDAEGRKIRSLTTSAKGKAEEETVWEYDDAGRLIREATALNGDWDFLPESTWEYDEEGRLLRRTGYVYLTDLEYFLQGKGSRFYEVDETYTYRPLSEALYM